MKEGGAATHWFTQRRALFWAKKSQILGFITNALFPVDGKLYLIHHENNQVKTLSSLKTSGFWGFFSVKLVVLFFSFFEALFYK